jgi:hypothetical protein
VTESVSLQFIAEQSIRTRSEHNVTASNIAVMLRMNKRLMDGNFYNNNISKESERNLEKQMVQALYKTVRF